MDAGQIIYSTLKGDGIPDPLASLVLAQAKHETNNFTSNVFINCNNAFGYKAVYNALPCLLSPEGTYYEKYKGVADSAHELSAYLYRRVADGSFPPLNKITSTDQYSSLLKKAGYYGAPVSVYAEGLARWYKSPAVITGAGILLIVAALIYFTRKFPK